MISIGEKAMLPAIDPTDYRTECLMATTGAERTTAPATAGWRNTLNIGMMRLCWCAKYAEAVREIRKVERSRQ